MSGDSAKARADTKAGLERPAAAQPRIRHKAVQRGKPTLPVDQRSSGEAPAAASGVEQPQVPGMHQSPSLRGQSCAPSIALGCLGNGLAYSFGTADASRPRNLVERGQSIVAKPDGEWWRGRCHVKQRSANHATGVCSGWRGSRRAVGGVHDHDPLLLTTRLRRGRGRRAGWLRRRSRRYRRNGSCAR